MKKYELYSLTDMDGNNWNVMEIFEPMNENEIDTICWKNKIDEIRGIINDS